MIRFEYVSETKRKFWSMELLYFGKQLSGYKTTYGRLGTRGSSHTTDLSDIAYDYRESMVRDLICTKFQKGYIPTVTDPARTKEDDSVLGMADAKVAEKAEREQRAAERRAQRGTRIHAEQRRPILAITGVSEIDNAGRVTKKKRVKRQEVDVDGEVSLVKPKRSKTISLKDRDLDIFGDLAEDM